MNKKDFAALVGKTPSDITRWLSVSHNFTILTLSLIEVKTGISLIKNLSEKEISKYLGGGTFTLSSVEKLNSEIKVLKTKVKELERMSKDIRIRKIRKSNNLLVLEIVKTKLPISHQD